MTDRESGVVFAIEKSRTGWYVTATLADKTRWTRKFHYKYEAERAALDGWTELDIRAHWSPE